MLWNDVIILKDQILARFGIIDEKLLLKNDVFRVVSRRVGVWAWGMLEASAAFLFPYAIAGGFARNTDPTLNFVQNTFRYYADKATNFTPIRWAKRVYQGIDGVVAGTLSFIDSMFNRLKIIPGYRLFTAFPLYLGKWEEKYKQLKNFTVLRAIWDRVGQPQLKKYVFAPYAKVASIYMAPYFDAALRYGDSVLSSFLGENYRGGESFSLASLENSCASGWQGSNILWRGVNRVLCGGGVDAQKDEMHQVVSGFSLSTAGIEKLAERHIETLGSWSTQVVAGFDAINQFALQAVDTAGQYGAQLINGVTEFGQCLATQKDLSGCSKVAFDAAKQVAGQAWSGYAQPALQTTWNFVNENARYALDEAWKSLLDKTPDAYKPYAKPVAIATTVLAAGTCAVLGYRWARHKWNQAPLPTTRTIISGSLSMAATNPASAAVAPQQQPTAAPPTNALAAGNNNVAQRVAAFNAVP